MKKILSVLIALAVVAVPTTLLASYGGSASSIGSSLVKDTCPNGDYSNSYYDNDCGTNPSDTDSSDDDATLASIDGYIYFDTNKNNVLDSGEQGVQGAVVTLKDSGGSILDTDVTGSNGYYLFSNVAAGTYRVHVSLPATKTTFVQDLLALFAPSAHAANDYEFTVVVGEGETGLVRTDNIPLVDGDVSSTDTEVEADMMEEEMMDSEEEMMNDDDNTSILDLIKNSNEDNGSLPTSPASSIGWNSGNGFVLPTSLPNTGASL